jgi:hypothetical protein
MAFERQNLSSWTTISRLLLTASVALSSNAHAIFGLGEQKSELRDKCELALANLNSKLGSTIDFGDIVSKPSAHVESAANGIHGGRLLTLVRDGNSWASMSAAEPFSPQGDPRWFIQLVGPEAAEVFGFKMLAKDKMTVPDAAELNGAITAVNDVLVQKGHEAIPISFYGVTSYESESVRADDYVRQFANGGLPLATATIERAKNASGSIILTDGTMLHAVSMDVGTITIPANLLKYRILNAQVITSFFDSMYEKYKSDAAKVEALKYYALEIEKKEKHSIDSASGAVVIAMMPITPEGDRRNAVNAMLGDKLLISRVVTETLNNIAYEGEKADKAAASLKPSEVEREFNAFAESNLGRQLSKLYDTFYSNGFLFSGDTISRTILAMNDRRQEIKEAALALAPKKAARTPKKKTATAKKPSKKTTAKKKSDTR